MININTSRWESVRLLFDKRIMGVNLKSNYGCQHSGGGSEASAAVDLAPRQKGRRVRNGRTERVCQASSSLRCFVGAIAVHSCGTGSVVFTAER